MATFIEGVDSEELLSELLSQYADRKLVLFHRAIAAGNLDQVTETLEQHFEWIDQSLLPVEAFEEVIKSNSMDYDSFTRFPGVSKQTTPYPAVRQFITGDSDEPNELFPTGEYDEPERNLDTVFWSPLMRACYSGNTEMIRLLSDLGANKNYQSPSSANCLDAIFQSVSLENRAANLRLIGTAENVTFHDYFYAALTDEDLSNVEIIQALLDIHCPVNRNSEIFQEDWTSWVNPEIVEILLPYVQGDH